jgi:hypothetical protein
MSNLKPTARRRRPQASTPFVGRDNFPSWEEVMGEAESAQSPAPASAPPADLDISFFSQASSLNMSIGARASLNEHLRHVQKYGLDTSIVQIDASQHASNPLDEEWDRLVESRDSPHNSNNTSSLEDTILHESATSEVGHESIEVMTNVSIDYFNSSRVNLLRTPTKNRSRRFNAVSTRGESLNQSSLMDDDDDDESDGGESATMLRMLAGVGLSPRKLTPPDQSFASFSALDISRISNDGIEGVGGPRRSPDCSFQDHRSTIDEPLQQSFLSHMEMAPGRDFRNTSGSGGVLSPRSSPPRRSPPRRSPTGSDTQRRYRNTSGGVLSPRSSPPRRSPPRRSPLRRSPTGSDTRRRYLHDYTTPNRGRRKSSAIRASKEKENAPTDDYFKDVIGLSPIGSRVGDPNKIPHPSQHPNVSFSTIDEGAPSFLHSINEAATPSLFHNFNEAPQTQDTSFSTIEEDAPSFVHNADKAATPSLFRDINEAPQTQDTSFSTIEEGAPSFLRNADETEAPQMQDTSFSTIEGGAPSILHNTDELDSPSFFRSNNETSQIQETAESPNDLLAGRTSVVEYNQTHDSTISTLNSSSAGKKGRRLTAIEYNRTHESEISTLNSSSAGKMKGVGNSSSIHFSPGSPLDPQDRRHYRTVVPSRVFMNATDDIPEQYDSFLSAPTPRTQPLLDSFDAAFHRSGYSDPT